MEKWSNTFYSDFLKEERTNCYWFWFKGKIGVKRDDEIDEYYLNKLETLEWNAQRLKDIVDKSAGDEDKAIALSRTQSNRITDEWKAINRSMCAKELYNNTKNEIYMNIFEVFFQRAYELGSVNKQDYREYQLEKIGL
jgi:hypothetical protein